MEQGSNYSFFLQHLDSPTFSKIYSYSCEYINELPKATRDMLYEETCRGTKPIESEPQLNVYNAAFGRMHNEKLRFAYEQLIDVLKLFDDITLIDFGCGQGIATLVLSDFMLDHQISKDKIKEIILIDTSEYALNRAELNVKTFYPCSNVISINKGLDDLNVQDLISKHRCVINLYSNILDIQQFSLTRLATVVGNSRYMFSYHLCVGPYFGRYSIENEMKTRRMENFLSLLNLKPSYQVDLSKGEWKNDWTCMIRYAKNESLSSLPMFKKNSATSLYVSSEYFKLLFRTLWYNIYYDDETLSEEFCREHLLEKGMSDDSELYNILITSDVLRICQKRIDDSNLFLWIVELYKQSAADGNLKAYTVLGAIYLYLYFSSSEDCTEDLAAKFKLDAIHYLEQAFMNQQSSAAENLITIYLRDKNYTKAFFFVKHSAESGNIISKYNLAVMYQNGYGCEINLKKAIELYESLALLSFEKEDLKDLYDDKKVIYLNDRGTAKLNSKYNLALYWTKKGLDESKIDYCYKAYDLLTIYPGYQFEWYQNFKVVLSAIISNDVNFTGDKKFMSMHECIEYFKSYNEMRSGTLAKYNWAICNAYGIGIKKNSSEAINILKELVSKKDDAYVFPKAFNLLAQCYVSEGLYNEAERVYREALECPALSDRYCQLGYNLSVVLSKLNKDEEADRLIDYYLNHACEKCRDVDCFDPVENKCPLCQSAMANRYLKCSDFKNFENYKYQAAKQGLSSAELYFGKTISARQAFVKRYNCISDEMKEVDSSYWLDRAAKHGEPFAEILLSDKFFKEGKISDHIYWLIKSAFDGDAFAQFKMSCYYATNKYFPKNWTECDYWLRKSADNNCVYAQEKLGDLYSYKNNNLEKAKQWYQKASDNGSKSATEKLHNILN